MQGRRLSITPGSGASRSRIRNVARVVARSPWQERPWSQWLSRELVRALPGLGWAVRRG